MSNFLSRSIRRKLILLFTATASVTVLLACASLWIYQLVHSRATLQKDEQATAQLIADTTGPALLFDDASAANESLSILRTDGRIRAACIYDKRGKPMAHFSREGVTLACPDASTVASRFDSHRLLIVKPILMKGETVGLLYLDVSLADMYRLLLRLAEIGFAVLFVAMLFALALSSVLQRIISLPILHLTDVATRIARGNDPRARARRISNDETGMLVDQFNMMLDHIQQRETDLQIAHDSLEDRVQERTQDLQNEIIERQAIERDLSVAKVLAEESNLAKSSFLANMSHELRTPLNAIIGYSEMLHEEATDEGLTHFTMDLDKVLLSARHLLGLISDILDFSKIEAGEMKLYPEYVLSSEVLDEVMPAAEMLATNNRNRICLVRPVWHGVQYVDPLRFRQCLLNLISNACKFTQDGTISIAVEQASNDAGSWIQWSVRDTGLGISIEEQGRLFQTFSQGDSSATRKYGGSGLGLAISQQLCKAMGGQITVSSTLGSGSTFTIVLPDKSSMAEEEEARVVVVV
ncbi:ATP-binding protein [Granulicella sibirica]|uniref:histidine kinase n=1 Tax=Granulicella sibirica TaxID=2479048 RepID=A0A4V1L566_9BACT|nr:ATP-binding protein [Granulicella sibirica]RXH54694.1 sensory box histidine kinase/response regulator [Granulicella sibirica]